MVLMKYHQKYGRQGNSTTYCSNTAISYITRTQQRDEQKAASSIFHKKGDLRIVKIYCGVTLTFIAAKIYNALLLNCIEPENEKILRIKMVFQRNPSTTSQILTIHQILGVCTKNLETTLLFVDFSKAFDSIHKGNVKQILLVYGLPKETVIDHMEVRLIQ